MRRAGGGGAGIFPCIEGDTLGPQQVDFEARAKPSQMAEGWRRNRRLNHG
mgnify:FL=1